MIRRILAITVIALVPICAPVSAEEGDYTPEDDVAMTRCLDEARAAMAADGATASPGNCIGTVSGPCMDSAEGSTTPGMAQCLIREATWWDMLLNAHYHTLRTTLDEESFAALREAQRAWISYSASNCEFYYAYWREGTIRSVFQASCVLEMAARRAIELEDFVNWSL